MNYNEITAQVFFQKFGYQPLAWLAFLAQRERNNPAQQDK
jgi:hypothetical protein